MTTTTDYIIHWKPSSTKSKVIITVQRDGATIGCDELNVQSQKQRSAFAETLIQLGCNADDLQRDLLEIAKQSAEQKPVASGHQPFSDEIDLRCVHRPERIIAPNLSAISIPILSASSEGVRGEWKTYMRLADNRQCVTLSPVLKVNETRLYIETMPPEPTVCDSSGWSFDGRQRWLAGDATVDAAELFKRLLQGLDHYIEFAPEQRYGYLCVLACWIVLSYVYHAWSSVGYLLVNGPASSGKSTIFNVLKELTFRPMATDNVSAAAIYRTLHNYGGTLLFDEAERLRDTKSPDIVEINSMLLAGYQRGRGATRLEKIGDGFKTVNYNVFGPKAVACINGVLSSLQTRCIEISTQRAAKDSPKPKRSMESTDWQSLRDDLHVLAIENGDAWIEAAKRRDIGGKLNGRDFEVWQPLLSIAAFFEHAGVDDLLELMESTAMQSMKDSEDLKTPEVDECILSILSQSVRDGIEIKGRDGHLHRVYQPTSAEILEACQQRASSLFRNHSPHGIGHRLRAYGLAITKSGSRREYRTDPDTLRAIQERYSVDLGF